MYLKRKDPVENNFRKLKLRTEKQLRWFNRVDWNITKEHVGSGEFAPENTCTVKIPE